MTSDFLNGFISIADSMERERIERIERSKNTLSTGVRYLDLALGRIWPNDLIIVGAKTGAGKSELVTSVAATNVAQGKRVHFFALEAEQDEIARRLKYRLIANKYWNGSNSEMARANKSMNYTDWYDGKLDQYLGKIEEEVEREVKEKFKNFYTFYRKSEDFGLNELKAQIIAAKNNTDLIIIDHLHYIDFEDSNENKAIADITKEIRGLALYGGKPIILVAHLRKTDRRHKTLIPDLDDFHGTSNIAKIATKAVLIGPCYDPMERASQYATYMRVAKNRTDGARCRFIAKCIWDASKNAYEPKFELSNTTFDDQTFEALDPSQMPDWTKG